MQSNRIFAGLHNLESRIRSQSGKEELKEEIEFVQRKYEQLDRKLQALQSETESLKQSIKYFIDNALPGNGRGDRTIALIPSNEKIVSVNRLLALSASPHIKLVMENDMLECRTNRLPLKEYSETVVKTMVVLLQIGEKNSSLMDLRKMNSLETYQLMELCSRLDIPWACMKIAKDIHQITALDAGLLVSSRNQLETCGEPFRPAWKLVCDEASKHVVLNIEQSSLHPDFSKLPASYIECLIKQVEDDDEFSLQIYEDRSDSFALRVECVGDKVRALVAVSSDCKTALCFSQHKVADFTVTINAEPNAKAVAARVLSRSEMPLGVASELAFENVFGDAQTRAAYAHGPDGQTFKISFRADMTLAHRQCFALINYVRHIKGAGRAASDDCSMLLLALQHFDQQNCPHAVSLLSSYAARSFRWLKSCADLLALPPHLVAGIISSDDLATDSDECAVLSFVADYAMAPPAAPPPRAQSAGRAGRAQVRIEAAEAKGRASARFEALVRHVRLPFVPTTAIFSRLSPDQLAFVGRHPSYLALLTEAVGVQQGAQPAPGSEGAQRAAKRARYDAMPQADLAAILESAHRALLSPPPP